MKPASLNEPGFFVKCETIFPAFNSFTKKEIQLTECGKSTGARGGGIEADFFILIKSMLPAIGFVVIL